MTDKDTWNRPPQPRLHGVPVGWLGDQLCLWLQDNGWKESEAVMPQRQKLGWVVRAIPSSEGFCHGVELYDQKIVTLSRYLFQHVRPVSEVIQNPGSGFRQREPRVDKQGDVDVETDKKKATDLERTASPA